MFVEVMDSFSAHPDPMWVNVDLIEAIIVSKNNNRKIKIFFPCGKEFRADRKYLGALLGNEQSNTRI